MEEIKNYRQSVIIDVTKTDAYEALAHHIPDWWSTVEGISDKEGADFIVSFGSDSFWKFKVISLDKPNKVVWECIESHQDHNLKGIDEEWINTKLYWSIAEVGKKTKIEFIHNGLLTTGVCYDVCSQGWDFYILDSLKNYLETGIGKPSGK